MNRGEKSSDHDKAWDQFWARDKGGGCLPEGWLGIDGAQRNVWHGFARRIDRNARVLDIATGDGRVMGFLLEARRDLKPLGIDLASKLPPPPRGSQVKCGVRMSALSLPDNRFGAVTSQFGFEYGDVEGAAGELARVARPGAFIGLLMHRADGPIVAHNLRRRAQIRWAIEERGLPGIARRSLTLRGAGLAVVPAEISTAPVEGARQFGDKSAAWEIAEAIRQTLVMGARDHASSVMRLIDEIEAQANNELGRIASLEHAANVASADTIPALLSEAGLAAVSRDEVCDGTASAPFANFLTFRKPA